MSPRGEIERARARRRLRAGAVGLAAGAAFLFAYAAGLQNELEAPRPSKLLVDRRGHYLGELPGEREELGYWPPPYVLPEKIVRATLETEDRCFFGHAGVRPQSIARAAWQNLRSREVISGASTIAMQVARLQSPGRRTLWRKAQEMGSALLLVRAHGHERVLRQYLTLAPYGNNVRGVARAARLYFDKPVEDLSWLQAAFLAGLPQQPARFNPYDPEGLARATRRAHRILRALNDRGVIDDEALRLALQSDLRLAPRPHRDPAALHAVLAWGARLRGVETQIARTTIDLDLQRETARLLAENLEPLRRAGAGNTAAIVVELETGNVLAHVGSADFFDKEARGAIDFARVKRSPGSALKPFLYALALERGQLTAASELPDAPVELPALGGRAWLPENANHEFFGPMLLREALANSRNIPALEVVSRTGITPALELFASGGVEGVSFEPGRYGLALAIGALPVTLEEVASLYGILARGGEAMPLRRFADEPPLASRRVLGREAAELITHILSDPLARRPSFPAGSDLEFDYAVAAKTGTSQGNRDAWAVGYSDRLVVAVWVGNHDARRMDRLTGLSAAGGAMHRIMDAAMPQIAPYRAIASEFPLSSNLVAAAVCPLSGRRVGPDCPHQKVELFVHGSEPVETCGWHARVRIDTRNGLRAGPDCPASFVREQSMLDLPETYATWALRQRLEVAPVQSSPLCAPADDAPPLVSIREPRSASRYLYDPSESAELRLSARVQPADEEIVWEVDGVPWARVGYPHVARWPIAPGQHTIVARMARRAEPSGVVRILVDD